MDPAAYDPVHDWAPVGSLARVGDVLCQRLPVAPCQHRTEVPHGHVVAVHVVGGGRIHRARHEVGRELVTVEVEVDPLGRAARLAAAQQADVEAARALQVVHGEGQVEGRLGHGV